MHRVLPIFINVGFQRLYIDNNFDIKFSFQCEVAKRSVGVHQSYRSVYQEGTYISLLKICNLMYIMHGNSRYVMIVHK